MFNRSVRRKASLLAVIMLLAACATPQRSTQARRAKARTARNGSSFSLYSGKSLDKKILNRGKKNLGSVAMESY